MATQLRGRPKFANSGGIPVASSRLLQALTTHRDRDNLFRAIVGELRLLTVGQLISVVLYEDLYEGVHWHAVDPAAAAASILPFVQWENSSCRWVYESQQPLVVNLRDAGLTDATLPALVSACIFPLSTPQRKLGALLIANGRDDLYWASTIAQLSPVVRQIGLAFGDAIHFAALQSTRARLESETAKLRLLLDLNNAIVSDLDLATLLRQISPLLRALMDVDAVALILPEPDNSLRLHALDFPGNPENNDSPPPSLPRNSLAGEVYYSGKPWIGSLSPSSQAGSQQLAALTGLNTVCALPLVWRDRILGVLGIGRIEEKAFAQSDVVFLTQITQQISIAVHNALQFRHVTSMRDQLIREKSYLREEIRGQSDFKQIIGTSKPLQRVLELVERSAPTECTVLLCGETGTGKELIARAIHDLSLHSEEPFVRLNCATLPAGLLESELFGHEKGAFTGASSRRIGRFEMASHGTIFLDEISELPLELQPKLLRVLQEREFERLGSSHTLRTNARLIAATNRNLRAMVASQTFRADLFYRLNVFPIELPPLRERAEDIPMLVDHFVEKFAQQLNKEVCSVAPKTMEAILGYPWPGNIRELQNVVERAVILSLGSELRIPLAELTSGSEERETQNANATLEEMERAYILSVLEQTNWVLAGSHGAAARLGIKRSTLQFRMKKLGLSKSA